MKKLLLLLLLNVMVFAASYKDFAVKYNYETSYEKAVECAKIEKKDILLIQVTNYCPWCRKLEKKVLARDVVDSAVHKDFIPLIVNREEHTLPKRFDTPIVPVTYIISYEDDSKFSATPGYKGKSDFLLLLKKGK